MGNIDINLGINHIDIENMLLSTFLFLNELGSKDELENNIFALNDKVFTSIFRKRVAEQINLVEDEAYSFLSYEIEQKCQGTRYEDDFINIISQSSLPLTVVKKYHDRLLENNKLKEVV